MAPPGKKSAQKNTAPKADTMQWLAEMIAHSGLDLDLLKTAWETEGKSHTCHASPVSPVNTPRWDHALIQKIVTPGSRVLDCGCGSGELLVELIRDHHVLGQGIEIDPEEVQIAVQHGVPVLQADLDVGLDGFGSDIFDFVILERTLQTVHRPLEVLKEMLRVGKVVIASFPNFAHWRNRLQLFLEGHMPRTPSIPYDWYETPNIHHMTIRDFKEALQIIDAQIVEGYARSGGLVHPYRDKDDLTAEEALFVLCRSTEYIEGAGI